MESLGEIYTAPYNACYNRITSTYTVSVECRAHYSAWNVVHIIVRGTRELRSLPVASFVWEPVGWALVLA